ncbi:MAG: hypothetical protein ACRBDX_11795 [Gammaproteobacteria bacterium]
MSTGVESFINIDELGAIYPMVGSEWLLVIIAVVFFVGCFIWRIATEKNEHQEVIECVRKQAKNKP